MSNEFEHLDDEEKGFEALKATLNSRTRVVVRGVSPASVYNSSSKVFNKDILKKPKYILYVAGVSDVISTVNFAYKYGIPLTARSGGHSYPGFSTIDDGLILDLSQLRGVRLDPKSKTVQVEAGSLLGDLDQETLTHHNLVVPTGIYSGTGLAGLTLGGGMGYLAREMGMTIDSLLSVDMILLPSYSSCSSARLVTITNSDEDPHKELFWALRGAGSNFGIVTSFEFQVQPVSPLCFFGSVTVFSSPTFELLRAAVDFSAHELPLSWSTVTLLYRRPPSPSTSSPPADSFPSSEVLPSSTSSSSSPSPSPSPSAAPLVKVLEILICINSPRSEQESKLQRLLEVLRNHVSDPTQIELSGMDMSFKDAQRAFDDHYSSIQCCYLKSGFIGLEQEGEGQEGKLSRNRSTKAPSDGALKVLLNNLSRIADHDGVITLIRLGGKVAEVPPTATAYWPRNAAFLFEIFVSWDQESVPRIETELGTAEAPDEKESEGGEGEGEGDEATGTYLKKREEKVSLVRSVFQELEPFFLEEGCGGVYSNFAHPDEGIGRTKASYGENFERLRRVKSQYDPTNFFRSNINIPPLPSE